VDQTVLVALEYPEVLNLLRSETVTPAGAGLALALRPGTEPDEVARDHRLTTEMELCRGRQGSLPFGTVPEVEPLLRRLAVDASLLAPLEVLDLLALMKAGRAVKAALLEQRAGLPLLGSLASDLPDVGNLVRFLDGKISTTGEVEDIASEALRLVRQDLSARGAHLKGILERLVARPEVTRALQDDFVSIRNERGVVPIRSEARAALPGIVHGVSGTGATIYVEPMETVDLNNEIVTLRDREATEIRRLLQEFSDLLRGRLAELRALWTGLGRLDLLSAKVRLGRALGARLAAISGDGTIDLRGARHPLVESSLRAAGEAIVPLHLVFAPRTPGLVISGPNTGGKTVALKTVGLFALMHQSGLPVPCDAAALPVFRGIHIDIGDRQSIADHLSTFSARMNAIAAIDRDLRLPALVLLDEVGTGTDPEEGAALGISIVDHFLQRGATVVATTHLEALKAHAATTPGCANAAMEVDEKSFTPTYVLRQGIPGRSAGLEMAERLGLPASIVASARARRSSATASIAAYLSRLQEMTDEVESRSRQVAETRRRLDAERAALEEEFRSRDERQRRALGEEIERALAAMREEGDRYLSSLRDREVAARLRRQETRAAADLRATARRLIHRSAPAGTSADTSALRPGTAVTVPGLGVRGVVESSQGDRVVLVVRGKRVTAARQDCREDAGAAAGPGPRLPPGVTLQRGAAAQTDVAPELHLRGLRVEEALTRVDKYLDDACLAGRTPVRLVHGTGSGRLRKAIAELLGRHPQVERFGNASETEGGSGVTVVSLRA
jgi:DNA mismatch repair protein MutS2